MLWLLVLWAVVVPIEDNDDDMDGDGDKRIKC